MDKQAQTAFDKMQKREHSLRVLRDQMGLGRITREVFREESLKVIERFRLSDDEQRAYDLHSKVQEQRKRK
ncbi:hypothetical protein KZ483_23980 [Paenibacillus sp. sptzw28]|uniref:hypothetical protein n=1 Tax=Paenibacillus sp. sptzw28 TaxID=715179 RepID=UPI001C6E131D|nr:hypothetical protein [Paenibacillus sp. sptzw28]QYR20782.1 hypothetical protein KZ483_23980 [Paenibacillus sp. sptzw28]